MKKREKREIDQLLRQSQDTRGFLSQEILFIVSFSQLTSCALVFFRPFYSHIGIIIRFFCAEIPTALNSSFST